MFYLCCLWERLQLAPISPVLHVGDVPEGKDPAVADNLKRGLRLCCAALVSREGEPVWGGAARLQGTRLLSVGAEDKRMPGWGNQGTAGRWRASASIA